ncbi:phosphopantetheine-binding protein, partial [Streptomyces mirabilis]
MRKTLPDYMVPSVYMMLERLPLTPNGKIDHRALPAPDARPAGDDHQAVAPRNTTEALLHDIWSALLNLPTISIHDSFFDLGGHSMLATKLVMQIWETLQVRVPVRLIFEGRTIAALATAVEEARARGTEPALAEIPRVSRSGDLVLSFAQQRLWFLDQLHGAGAAY